MQASKRTRGKVIVKYRDDEYSGDEYRAEGQYLKVVDAAGREKRRAPPNSCPMDKRGFQSRSSYTMCKFVLNMKIEYAGNYDVMPSEKVAPLNVHNYNRD